MWAVGSLVVRASDSRRLHAEIVEMEIEVVSPSIVPSGNFAELNRTVTCMVLKANDRRTSCPCHDEFHGPRSDYAINQPQQCHSDNSGLSRRNRIQEKLRFCSHAFLPRSTNQSGHSLPGRPTHIRPHTQSKYGMEERFAFRFPETPSIQRSGSGYRGSEIEMTADGSAKRKTRRRKDSSRIGRIMMMRMSGVF
ncbi:hypothetical protein TNCV_4948061 [Trichonephila clavipes]|nr:hypothetical protein TNCV_4948061 [Trichonephila clavipes]